VGGPGAGPRSDLAELLGSLPANVGVAQVQRWNLVADPDAGGPTWPHRLLLRDELSHSTRGTRIAPKVAHRAHPDVVVAQGNHAVSSEQDDVGLTVEFAHSQMLHVPLRSEAQYRRKIANGGSSYANNTRLAPATGWHWREDHALLLAGKLDAVVGERLLDPARKAAGLADGTLAADTRLRDRLLALVPAAVRPDALVADLDG